MYDDDSDGKFCAGSATRLNQPAGQPGAAVCAGGLIVNQTELAELLGVTDVTLWHWQGEGMPVLARGVRDARGQSNHYDTAAVIAWMEARAIRRATRPETPKERLARLQGDKIEREIAEIRNIHIPVSEIRPAWAAIEATVRQELGQLGRRLAPRLEAVPGIEAKRAIIDEAVDELLTTLAIADPLTDVAVPGSEVAHP